MNSSSITYLVFGIVLVLAVIFDLDLMSRKGKAVTIKKALFQTAFWVGLALAFFGFLWLENGHQMAVEYLSAYLMEWSLSIDNIFVFILIFTFFRVKPEYYARVLLIGILTAILLRIVFITVGIALVARFHWILYLFGGLLVYTGISMFVTRHDEALHIEDNRVYRLLKRVLPGILHYGIKRRVDREPAIVDLVLRQQLIQITLDCVHRIILLDLGNSLGVRHDFYAFRLFGLLQRDFL